jgi:glycine hydroxymethyltransferase
MVLTNDEALAKKINSAVFPGLQGGPLMHVIAAKAVAFAEALRPEFKDYAAQVVKNAQAMADQLMKGGINVVSGGTDNHLCLADLRPKKVTGKAAEAALGRAHITCNKNGVPFDPESPFVTSGIRLGAPAGTTRGFGEAEFRQIADWIVEVVDGLSANGAEGNSEVEDKVKSEVAALCARHPLYPDM